MEIPYLTKRNINSLLTKRVSRFASYEHCARHFRAFRFGGFHSQFRQFRPKVPKIISPKPFICVLCKHGFLNDRNHVSKCIFSLTTVQAILRHYYWNPNIFPVGLVYRKNLPGTHSCSWKIKIRFLQVTNLNLSVRIEQLLGR